MYLQLNPWTEIKNKWHELQINKMKYNGLLTKQSKFFKTVKQKKRRSFWFEANPYSLWLRKVWLPNRRIDNAYGQKKNDRQWSAKHYTEN